MKNLATMDWTALAFLIVGGINWGMIALFNIDLVIYLLGDMTIATRIVYGFVAASALYMLYVAFLSATFESRAVPYTKVKNATT
jgi:hypothetical protein